MRHVDWVGLRRLPEVRPALGGDRENGLAWPTDEQWELVDSIVGRWLDRQWRPESKPHMFAPWWRNIAYLRSQIIRHVVTLPAVQINTILDRIESRG